jgi:hypothetical protein
MVDASSFFSWLQPAKASIATAKAAAIIKKRLFILRSLPAQLNI